MNSSSSSTIYSLEPAKFPVNQIFEIELPSDSANIQEYLRDISVMGQNIPTETLMEANIDFNSWENQLDYTNLDNSHENVIVCPMYQEKIDLSKTSLMLSPQSMSPVSFMEDDDLKEIDIGTAEQLITFCQLSSISPPLSPKEIVEKSRFYVNKKKKTGNKRGRPAKKSHDDIQQKIKEISSVVENMAGKVPEPIKRKMRVCKNNIASRDYRKKLAQKRETIDMELERELKRFEELSEQHRRLKEEIQHLETYISGRSS